MTRSGTGRPVPITGGAGFVGSILAERLLRAGTPVIIPDNLSHAGLDRNLRSLRGTYAVQSGMSQVRE